MRCPEHQRSQICNPGNPAAHACNGIPQSRNLKTAGQRYQQSLWAAFGGPGKGLDARQAASACRQKASSLGPALPPHPPKSAEAGCLSMSQMHHSMPLCSSAQLTQANHFMLVQLDLSTAEQSNIMGTEDVHDRRCSTAPPPFLR